MLKITGSIKVKVVLILGCLGSPTPESYFCYLTRHNWNNSVNFNYKFFCLSIVNNDAVVYLYEHLKYIHCYNMAKVAAVSTFSSKKKITLLKNILTWNSQNCSIGRVRIRKARYRLRSNSSANEVLVSRWKNESPSCTVISWAAP